MIAIQRFVRDETGSSAIEYGLIIGIISCLIISALGKTGTKINTKFTSISNALN